MQYVLNKTASSDLFLKNHKVKTQTNTLTRITKFNVGSMGSVFLLPTYSLFEFLGKVIHIIHDLLNLSANCVELAKVKGQQTVTWKISVSISEQFELFFPQITHLSPSGFRCLE